MLTQTVLFPELERHQSRCNGEEFSPMVIVEAPESIRRMPTQTIEEKIAKAKAVLKWVMSHHSTAFSTSHGKDSSTTVGLALCAAAEMAHDGIPVKPFVILTAGTGVENPAIATLARQEMGKITAWIKRHGLPGSMHVAEPHLASSFAVSIIGGRAIPSMQGHKRDCTVDWKVEPLTGTYVVHQHDWDEEGQPKPMSGWLLDGQQRISALRDFLSGEMVIFGDVRFTDMSIPDQLRFKRRPFPCHELDYTDDEDKLMELYDRLNFGGTPHAEAQRALPSQAAR